MIVLSLAGTPVAISTCRDRSLLFCTLAPFRVQVSQKISAIGNQSVGRGIGRPTNVSPPSPTLGPGPQPQESDGISLADREPSPARAVDRWRGRRLSHAPFPAFSDRGQAPSLRVAYSPV